MTGNVKSQCHRFLRFQHVMPKNIQNKTFTIQFGQNSFSILHYHCRKTHERLEFWVIEESKKGKRQALVSKFDRVLEQLLMKKEMDVIS